MVSFPTTNDFHRLVVESVPLMDVRAPVEFAGGAFPLAVNFPILDDGDRHEVGICYKAQGKEAAFALAHKRVSSRIKEQRVSAWVEFHEKKPDALFYCLRGGMRSRTAQEWFKERTGKTIGRLEGGYKSFRRFLINALEPKNIPAIPVVLGGRTGTGKTILLNQLKNSIDLEAIANHRGSAFGGFLSPQPCQVDFENILACALIRHTHKGEPYLVIEDEGSYIGARNIPQDLASFFRPDSLVLLERELEERVAITFEEYITQAQADFCRHHEGSEGLQHWLEYMLGRLHRIRKRLGGLRTQNVVKMMENAHDNQLKSGDSRLHREWIHLLLADYYDPMYDYQISKGGRKIIFSGGYDEVLAYLKELESC